MHSCSKTGKKNQWLSRSITLALLSCMFLPLNNAQAETVNMTNADNTVIEKYAYGTDNTYIYGHDSIAPATISLGAKSPPIASTAIFIPRILHYLLMKQE